MIYTIYRQKKFRKPRYIVFYWKIQLEKVQLTLDLKNNTILYQNVYLPCKTDQRYCHPTIRILVTTVWFPEYTCTIFKSLKFMHE